MKIISILSTLVLTCQYLPAQFARDWAHSLGSTTGDIGYAITTDPGGNVIITGHFNGTVDFDPGAGISNLTASGNNDAYLAKYTASGSFLWARAFGSADTDAGEAVATDAAGNIYLGMGFGNTVDMDPGPGVASFTSPGFSSSVIAKYDANGNYLWGFMLASPSSSSVSDIRTDASNNVYFTGSFHGTVDFDPGAAVNNLVSNGNSDIFFAKYDANGNYLLAKSFGAGAFDTGTQLEVDAGGNIIVTGYYRLTVDFDPGPGVANITASGTLNDVFFAKYDAAGNYVWAGSIGATSNDIPGGISIDASGNVTVAGGFNGTVDFDPGAGTANLTSIGTDIFIARYDASGNYNWAKRIGSTGSDAAYSITGDGTGGFYIAGEFSATVDFDPDGATANLTSNGSTDVFIARYTSGGGFAGVGNMGGSSSDIAQDIALVDANNILVTGYFLGTADFDPGAAVNNLNSAGVFDVFFGKYRSITGTLPVTLSLFTTQCIDNGIRIDWSSRQEQNAKSYFVERSYSGGSFDIIATIAAAGNSNNPLHYSFVDDNIVSNKTIYYRLKQLDADGNFTYSKIITASCAAKAQEIHLFPNPAEKEVTVSLGDPNEEIKAITIVDVSGRTVKMIMPLRPGRITIDIAALQKGVYWMVIQTNRRKLQKNFVK